MHVCMYVCILFRFDCQYCMNKTVRKYFLFFILITSRVYYYDLHTIAPGMNDFFFNDSEMQLLFTCTVMSSCLLSVCLTASLSLRVCVCVCIWSGLMCACMCAFLLISSKIGPKFTLSTIR